MTYIERMALDIARRCDDPEPDADDLPLYRIYAVLALTKGERVEDADVHDAWSAWQMGIMPEHRSIVPFDELSADVQAMDTKYTQAIHAAARDMVRQINLERLAPIRARCVANLERNAELGINAPADVPVYLTIAGQWGKRDQRRLWPGGPMGRIVGQPSANEIVIVAKAQEVIAAIDRMEATPAT